MTTDVALAAPKSRPDLLAELKKLLKSLSTTVRTTGRLAVQIGERLLIVRAECKKKGEWGEVRKELKIGERSAQVYMQIARAAQEFPQDSAGIKTIDAMLAANKKGKRLLRADGRAAILAELLASAPEADKDYPVIHGDCRKIEWPHGISCIVGDPPWGDMSHYEWLADFSAEHLADGGILLAQCGQMDMADVLTILGKRLTYVYTLAIVYEEIMPTKSPSFSNAWRPVIVLSKGKWDRAGVSKVTDTMTVRGNEDRKPLHEWQQPLEPFVHWLGRMTTPNSLIVDPFTCTGTIGLAVKKIGEGRRYIGCEIDEQMVKVARARIAANGK